MPDITKKDIYKSTNVRENRIKLFLVGSSLNALSLLFPQKTRLMIKNRFFTPVRRKPTLEEKQWLNRATNFQIRVHGKTLQCWKWGEGPLILTVHGWNGRGVTLHPLFEPLLEQGYGIIGFDAPAHGDSEGSFSNYFEYTDAVRSIVNAMGKDRLAGIIAHSLGAAAVINCLSKEKMGTPTVLIAPALRLRELLNNTFANHGVPAHLYQSIIREMEKEYGYSLEKDNPFDLLEQIKTRVMIAHDHDDALIPFADARMIAQRHEHIVLHATRGQGHKNIIGDIRAQDVMLNYLSHPVPRIERQLKRA